MNLTPQAIKILEILEDGYTHCGIDWGYADGHGRRITDINRYLAPLGKTLAYDWCNCGRHKSKIRMRWVAPLEAPQTLKTASVGFVTPKVNVGYVQPLFQHFSVREP